MKSVVTIGTFDGVHLGHQALIAHVCARATTLGVLSAVVTFEPIPISVLRPDRYRGRITSPEEKLRLLRDSGVDHIEVISFTQELASQSPDDFLTSLVDRLGMTELWVGDDFALGKNRSGTIDVITELGHQVGFETHVFERLAFDQRPLSSTTIRQAIEAGDVARAAQILGRPFRVSGEVIHGAHLGRKIGCPTANFVPPAGMIPLADGIYASRASVPGRVENQPAMTYIGTRPTVDGGDRQVETHLLDFDGDLYGAWLTVDIVDRVRGDQTFDGLEPLIAQLRKDEMAIREILQVASPDPHNCVDRTAGPC